MSQEKDSQEINTQSLKIYIPIFIDLEYSEQYYIVGVFKDIKTAIKDSIIKLVHGSHIANLDKQTYLEKNSKYADGEEKSKKDFVRETKNDEEFIEYMYSKYEWNEDNYQDNLDELCETFGTYYDRMWRVDIVEKNLI
jgi:hypothetical protein